MRTNIKRISPRKRLPNLFGLLTLALVVIVLVTLMSSNLSNFLLSMGLNVGRVAGIFSGNTYFVSPSGNDTYPGSETQPFKTIKKAASVAQAGDTVKIKPGTYNESVEFPRSGTSGSPITFVKDGSSPVTVKGSDWATIIIEKKDWIVVDGLNILSGTGGYGVIIRAGSYNTIKNCDVSGGEFGIHVLTGSYASPVYGEKAYNNVISGNTVHNMSGEGIYVKNYMPADVTVSTTQNTIVEKNIIYSVVEAVQNTADTFVAGSNSRVAGGIAPSGTIIRGNNIYNNKCDSGVMDIQGDNVLIENNLVHNNPGGTHCDIFISSPGKITVRNNVIYKNGGSASWRSGIYAYNPQAVDIYHNTIYGEYNGINIKNPSGTVNVKNNIFNSITASQIITEGDLNKIIIDKNLFGKSQSNMGSNSNIGEPAFTNPSNNNFRLTSNSTAIDKGVNLGVISDVEGITRPQGSAPDLGAYEFSSGGTTPIVITSPTPIPTAIPTPTRTPTPIPTRTPTPVAIATSTPITVTPKPMVVVTQTPQPTSTNFAPYIASWRYFYSRANRNFSTNVEVWDYDTSDTLSLNISGLPAGVVQRGCYTEIGTVWYTGRKYTSLTCTISGTPTTRGTFPVYIKGSDNHGATATKTVNFRVR